MIRLAVCGDEARWQMVAARLRGGSINCSLGSVDSHWSSNACDAVLLVAPGPQASGMIARALDDGKHVCLASPTELPRGELDSFAAAAKQTGVQLAVVNPDRYLPSRQLLRQQLDAGKLGRPGLVRMYRWEPTPANSSNTLPSPLLLDLDLAVWMMGLSPNSVFATETRRTTDGTESGRTIQVHLGFPDGPMALIGYSSALPSGDDYRSLSVMGSAGAAYADDHQNMQLVYRGQHPQAFRVEEGIRPLVNLTQDFVDALQTQRDLSPSLVEWHRVRTIADAVEQSLISRQAVSLEGCQS